MKMMLIPSLALILLSAVGGGQAEVVIAGPDNVEVSAGGEAILNCRVKQPFKFCSFINPTGTVLNVDPHLSHEEGRISIAGSEEAKKNCGVKISPVVEADNGVWRCKVTVVIDGEPQIGRSQANVMVLNPNSLHIGAKLNQSEEDGGGEMEASANATVLNSDHSQMKNDIATHQMGDVEEQLINPTNETKSNDLENEETTIVSSTTIASEVELNYTEEDLGGATNRSQTWELRQATSSAPLVVYEVNPSAENSDEKYFKEAVSKLKPPMEEESKNEEPTDLSEEHVVVVTIHSGPLGGGPPKTAHCAIIAMIIFVIIFIAIAKIKKLLCFKAIDGDGEDAEKSTLRMYSFEKTSKSSQKSQNSTYDEVKEGNNP